MVGSCIENRAVECENESFLASEWSDLRRFEVECIANDSWYFRT